MSLQRTLTTFIVDISPTMGRQRTIIEDVVTPEGEVLQKERTMSNVEWCLEFVNRKTQAIMFSKLKTATMSIVTFGSPRTNNGIVDKNPEIEGYRGVDELTGIGQPTVATLDLLASLRAVREDEGGEPPDPLDALICALDTMSDKSRGGVAPTAKSWRKTIYLITDGSYQMNRDSTEAIAERIKEDNVSLRVIGVDFDDEEYGFKEEDKDPVKADNEAWWHEWLATLPNARIATAAHALEQATLPTVSLKSSTPYNTRLTFGDRAHALDSEEVLGIPVKMYKLTSRALPMSRRPISKFAEEAEKQRRAARSANGGGGGGGGGGSPNILHPPNIAPTATPSIAMIDASSLGADAFGIENRKVHFLADQVKQLGTENATALPEGAEHHFGKAFRLGASLIPITPDLDVKWQSEQGLEIINFVKHSTLRRHYLLGEISNVFADDKNVQAQCTMSAMVKAMRQQDKVAIVRFVRRDNAEPKIGILFPVERVEGETRAEYFHFAEAPFSEDLKRYLFKPLTRAINLEGQELEKHSVLPTDRMVAAMDRLVDSMDLMHAFKDEEGQDQPWFAVEDSFNPGIHRMKEAVAFRCLRRQSDGSNTRDIPRPHWEVDKFLDRPLEVKEKSAGPAEECKRLFRIHNVPEVRAKGRALFSKRRNGNRVMGARVDAGERVGEETELDLSLAEDHGESSKRLKDASGQAVAAAPPEDSDSEEEMISSARRAPAAESPEAYRIDDDDDDQARPVRLIPSDPVTSFNAYLEDVQQDTAAVLRALEVLIVSKLIAERNDELAVEALKAGRKAASEYDEARQWNWFVARLKGTSGQGADAEHDVDGAVSKALRAVDSETVRAFWETHCKGKMEVAGMITREEDEGGRSEVTAEEARNFVE